MGVMDWINGDDGSESEPVATDGLGFDDDLDDFDDGMDGEFDEGETGDGFDDGGMDDLGGEMGGFDDDGMDDLGGEMGGGGGLDDSGGGLGGPDIDPDTIAEMEDRISELENQVSSTTSEMSTVREENKQIGETVEELDDTIRKLLDIYEMVTRGINPFVDDAREMGGLENEGAFGLFEMEEESEDDLDPEVADADAEAFFDEDFGDLDAEEDEAELAAGDELEGEEREDPAAALDDDADDLGADNLDEGDDAGGGGTSFDDLKSEYEENGGWDEIEGDDGEADEDVELDEAESDAEFDDEAAAEAELEDTDDEFEDDLTDADAEESPSDADVEESSSDAIDEFVESEPVDPESVESAPDAQSNGTLDGEQAAGSGAPYATAVGAGTATADSDAYLTEIPPRYTAESVVLEWTQFLVDVGGAVGATRALRQYREQGWITQRVERTVAEHVRNAAVAGGTEETRDLRVQDHRESLTYISRLAGDVNEARLLEELSALGGGSRGIRR